MMTLLSKSIFRNERLSWILLQIALASCGGNGNGYPGSEALVGSAPTSLVDCVYGSERVQLFSAGSSYTASVLNADDSISTFEGIGFVLADSHLNFSSSQLSLSVEMPSEDSELSGGRYEGLEGSLQISNTNVDRDDLVCSVKATWLDGVSSD